MSLEAIVLGIAQDGGVPQSGCACRNCRRAWAKPTARRFSACLALIDHTNHQFWLIDATPDFREQLHALQTMAPQSVLAGIFLTHAHVGHYVGLIHLGREVMGTQDLPVYTTPDLASFLRGNAPWSQLIELRSVRTCLLSPDQETQLGADLYVTPWLVPHRNEFADTVALVVRGSISSLFYCPDIDGWDRWERDLRSVVEEMDIALLDATYFSADELSGRPMSEVPHPLVTDTIARLTGVFCDVRLIHLNHTNPLLTAGPERDWLTTQGFRVGAFGDRWVLG